MKAKNIQQKLRSYSSLAAAFMLTATTDATAQCGSTAPGAPLDIDIDGDGIADVSLVQNTTEHYFRREYYSVYSIRIRDNDFGTGFFDFASVRNNSTVSMDSVNGINTNSFSTTSSNSQFFNFPIASGLNVIPAGSVFYPVGCPEGAAATVTFSYGYLYYNRYVRRITYTFTSSREGAIAYAQPAVGNSIVGLASSGSVCNAALVPENVTLGSNGTYRAFGTSYRRTFTRRVEGPGFPLGDIGLTCDGTPAVLGALLIPYRSVTYNTSTSGIFIDTTTTFQNTNPTEYLAVQFQADPDGDGINETYNGWVALTIDPATSQITCTDTGYQQCSVEDATAVGDAALACITTNEATNSNAACVPVCEITAQIVEQMCNDNATPELGADDIITFTVVVNGTNGTTWSDNQGNTGQTYGTAFAYSLAAGSTLNLTFSDDDTANNPDCTSTITLTATDCMTIENIPTTSEWGLLILGLLMSITAVVGIRQFKDEEYVLIK